MRVPQVSERIKEAPAQALRGVFAGIGQLLLVTDKLRNKAPADRDAPQARAPETAETVTDVPVTSPAATATATAEAVAEPADKAPKPQSSRDFDKTGNVRLLGDEDGGSVPDAEPVSAPAAAAPPLPNYDELSVASLRARLRNLDVTQVRQLADYERAHAGRADVLGMFERRIAKLEAEA